MSEPTLYRKRPDLSCLACDMGSQTCIALSGDPGGPYCCDGCDHPQYVPVEPDYEAGAEEIGRLVYVQLANIGYQTAVRRIVKAVFGIGDSDE